MSLGSRARKVLKSTFAGPSLHRTITRFSPCYYELKQRGIVDYFAGYPKEAIKPEWDDLWGIYRLMMDRQPAVALELGGGYSTFVFAHTVIELRRRGKHVAFYSVDESDHWQGVVREHMPEHLACHVRFFRATPILTELRGQEVSRFDCLPVDRCNFLYVDGGLAKRRTPGIDALFLERNAPDDYAILVDGRDPTVTALQNSLALNYTISKDVYGKRQTLFARSSTS